jgi:hypothetical protein
VAGNALLETPAVPHLLKHGQEVSNVAAETPAMGETLKHGREFSKVAARNSSNAWESYMWPSLSLF